MSGFSRDGKSEFSMDGVAETPNQIIRASAGTGKTYQLSNRYLTLLLQGCTPDRILATTFTRKAAGEILSRVLSRLAEAAASDDGCQQLSKALDMALTVDQCRNKLREVTSTLHRVRVGTLDSFFGQVAHSFSLEIGLPPRWEIADPAREIFLRGRGIEKLLGDDGDIPEAEAAPKLVRLLAKGELKRGINEVLQTAVGAAYSLFQASERAAWTGLRRRKASDDNQLQAVLEDLRTCDCNDPSLKPKQVSMFENQRNQTHLLALNGAWDTLLEKGVMSKVILEDPTYRKHAIPQGLLDVLLQLKEHLRDHFVNQTASINESTFTLLKRFGGHFDQLKVEHGNFQFDDLPRLLTRVVKGDLADLDFRIDSHIDHLLLDEFQDTSRIQWEALQPFAKSIVGDSSTSKSLFCVGDSKQAIYGWRGGMPEIFDRIASQFDVRESSLDQSFRSAQPIIDTVNSVFQKLPQHSHELGTLEMGVNQWCQDFPEHTTARKELTGYADIRVTAPPSDSDKAPEVALRAAVDLAAELSESHPGRSIGLLMRSNDKVANAIGQFKQLGIPASEEGGNPLTDSAAVLLICSLLRMADHPADTVAVFHVCHSQLACQYGLGPETNRQGREVVAAASAIRQQLLDLGYGKCIDGWAKQLRDQCGDREWTRVQQLVTLAYQHETTLLPRDFVTLVETKKISDPTAATIRVMTVHQSKGLQFDIVILGELESQLRHVSGFVAKYNMNTFEAEQVCLYVGTKIRSLLPTRYQEIHDDYIARLVNETLCILYVAMTRAVHALHMVVVPTESSTPAMTYAGLIRAAICDNRPLKPGTIPYQVGDANWHANATTEPKSQLVASSAKPLHATAANLPPIKFAAVNENSLRRLQPTTPSRLEGGSSVRLRPKVTGQNNAMLLGTLFHAWMEQIEWIEGGLPDEALLRDIASQIGVSGDALSMAMKHFEQATKSKTTTALLSQQTYTQGAQTIWDSPLPSPIEFTVYREQRISVRRDRNLLNGTIDRLVVARHNGQIVAAEVIDFKTDRLGSRKQRAEKIASSVEHYRPQMLAYRDAVSTTFRLAPDLISMRLAFVLEDEVVRVDTTGLENAKADDNISVDHEAPSDTSEEMAVLPKPPETMATKSVRRVDAAVPTTGQDSKSKSKPKEENSTEPTSQPKQMRLF